MFRGGYLSQWDLIGLDLDDVLEGPDVVPVLRRQDSPQLTYAPLSPSAREGNARQFEREYEASDEKPKLVWWCKERKDVNAQMNRLPALCRHDSDGCPRCNGTYP